MKKTFSMFGKLVFTAFFGFQAIVLVANESAQLVSSPTEQVPMPQPDPLPSAPSVEIVAVNCDELQTAYGEGLIDCAGALEQTEILIDQLSYEFADCQDQPIWGETIDQVLEFQECLPCLTEEIIEEGCIEELAGVADCGCGAMAAGGYGGGGGAGGGLGLLPLAGLAGLAGLSGSDDNPSPIIVSP